MFCDTNCTIVGIPDWGFYLSAFVVFVAAVCTALSFTRVSYGLTSVAAALSQITLVVLAPVWVIIQLAYGLFPDFYQISTYHYWSLTVIGVAAVCALLTFSRSVEMSVKRDMARSR